MVISRFQNLLATLALREQCTLNLRGRQVAISHASLDFAAAHVNELSSVIHAHSIAGLFTKSIK